MLDNLITAYDKQTIADVFVRYTQNRVLLSILGNYINKHPQGQHIDIGFSGRLSMILGLSKNVSVLNLSEQQLRMGISVFKGVLEFYTTQTKKLDREPDIISHVPDIWKPLVREMLVEQVEVVAATGSECRLPENITVHHTVFRENTINLHTNYFQSLSMIDVVVHIDELDEVFNEIQRVIAKDGVAIITYFPPGGAGDTSTVYVNQIFGSLCNEFSIDFDLVYSFEKTTVYPQKFYNVISALDQSKADTLIKSHWLDLPFFKLHTDASIAEAIARSGLRVIENVVVPGGMYPAFRRLVVLTK